MYDAIVVGAGPTGSHVAGELANQGHRVVVLEQHDKIGKKGCCTGIVGRECVERFPVARLAVAREAMGARFFSPSSASFTLQKDSAQAYILDRQAFDEAMAANAQKLGAEYLLSTKAKGVTVDGGKARVEAESEGQPFVLDGKVVVMASGFASGLPDSLGLGKFGDFVMGAQAEVETKMEEVEVYLGSRFSPGFFAWLVPTRQGQALAGLLARRDTKAYIEAFLRYLKYQGKIASPQAPLRFGGVPLKPLRHTSGNRVIVIGDAAGQVKPTTGGGIYYGLLSADIAVDVLDQAITGNDCSARALSEYERRWEKLLARELRIGRWARRAFERLSDRRMERLFRMVQDSPTTDSLLNAPDFSFDWHSRLILRALWRFGPRVVVSLVWPG
ncbi:MAG: NAD(P)/FAD-dependent oxidoreductase [Dehalococcoidia bacterium]|nr:NAD(P)/FAD-dependent oxidoreductase [Dehalococcoidia bacterium]